jgi:hypothetical protein
MTRDDEIPQLLWPPAHATRGAEVYAVLDAACDPRIRPAVAASELATRCLYAGALPPELLEVAPYVVHMRPGTRLTRKVLASGWGRAWGIWLVSAAEIEALRRHLRRFLRVRTEGGRRLLFRYYDPLVLASFLPTCSSTELATLFGPVDAFIVEAGPAGIVEYRFDGVALHTHTRTAAHHTWRLDAAPLATAVAGPLGAFVVRDAQLAALHALAEQRAVGELAELTRRSWPHATRALGEPRLQARIRGVIEIARRCGIADRTDVLRVINAAMALAEDFHPAPRTPWVADLLADERFPIADRLDDLAQRITAQLALGGAA